LIIIELCFLGIRIYQWFKFYGPRITITEGTMLPILIFGSVLLFAPDCLPQESSPPSEVTETEKAISLEELLKTEVPELAKENPVTNDNWRRFIDALAKNDFDSANGYSKSLLAAKEVLSPMRLEFCVVYEEIVKKNDDSSKIPSPTLSQIVELDQKLENLKNENQTLLIERPKVYKKIEDKNKAKATSAIIGSLIGAGLGAGLGAAAGGGDGAAIGAGAGAALGAAGGYGYAAADSPEVRLQYIEKRLPEISYELSVGETQKNQLRQQLSSEEKQMEEEANRARILLRDRVIRLMDRFADINEFQPGVAVANAFLKNRGMDSLITGKSSELYQEQSNVARILKIAHVIRREVESVYQNGSSKPRPWSASRELEKKVEMTKNSIKEEKYIKILEKELYGLREDLARAESAANKQRKDLLALAERDAEDAFPKLEAYGAFYRDDDPSYNNAWLRVKDLRQEQAEERVRYYMKSVEEAMANDPEKAKLLLLGLLGKSVPEVEKVILESKIAAAFKQIHQKEIGLIRLDLDEAQSYLTKYSLETGSEAAEVDLSSLSGQIQIDKSDELQESLTSAGAGIGGTLLPVSGGITATTASREKMLSESSGGNINAQKKTFAFTGRLFVGVENVERCLSLLEGSAVRAKLLQKDENLDKLLAGRLGGLVKSIDISLEQLKTFRDREISARKFTWAAWSSGVLLATAAGTGGLFKLLRRKHPPT
jgi:hypothetical protein